MIWARWLPNLQMLKLVQTEDGSNTIYNDEVGENYHSTHGALQESKHVFVNSGLQYFLDKSPTQPSPVGRALKEPLGKIKVSPTGRDYSHNYLFSEGVHENSLEGATVSILEVGFGTGLNFLLSADLCTDKKIHLDYTGIEAYPLSPEMIAQTGYDQYVSSELWQQFIDNYTELLLSPVALNPRCKLQIANSKLENFQSEQQYDIIYYDAFASARQPEMWDVAAINHTIQFLKPGGVFVTYAITGNLKRALKALGCKVEKAPGALGKREMLRAIVPQI
jgi:tRNA U34 5-methylaminomethyl-2-thiouridine-forming methyltransferase MnmC